jgi:hypothetical protein
MDDYERLEDFTLPFRILSHYSSVGRGTKLNVLGSGLTNSFLFTIRFYGALIKWKLS